MTSRQTTKTSDMLQESWLSDWLLDRRLVNAERVNSAGREFNPAAKSVIFRVLAHECCIQKVR